MTRLTFSREQVRDCWEELQPLFASHHREVSTYQDLTVSPSRARYEAVEMAGALRFYTARTKGGALVGYIGFIVLPSAHYADTLTAHQDAVFLAPTWRRGLTGLQFLAWVDAQLTAEGVALVYQSVMPANDWSPLLLRLGYQLGAQQYCRRLNG